jgi:hypothetical protein
MRNLLQKQLDSDGIGYYKRYLSTSSHILCRKSIIVDKKVSDFLFDC